jgi:kynurenine 3-monooxygenase
MSNVAIIGAGLAGSLLAIYLARRGMKVDVYEARSDMRLKAVAAGRSINLALSDRGIAALREVGMDEYMLAEAVPMHGRMIHTVSGEMKLLPYSGRSGEYINSVSRAGLNIALMNEAEKYEAVTFHFNERCIDFNCETGEAKFSSGKHVVSDTLIATDGAGSAVRNAMLHGGVERFDFSQDWLDHGYKELIIPSRSEFSGKPPATADGSAFLLEKNALHIWPRHQFMMIALPNFDGSFTCTLFLAHKSAGGTDVALKSTFEAEDHVESREAALPPTHVGGSDSISAFDALTDEVAVHDFFKREFPDALELMPTLAEDFFQNPTGNLGTIKCFPWNAGGKALLLGDAAHAIVPFFGQGMNCSFEDVRVLAGLIDASGSEPVPLAAAGGALQAIDWERIYEKYSELRKINTDAIADMAEENFYEMRDRVADPVFQRKRELETKLEQTYPDYFSKYSMVTFREDMPYSVAKENGNAQDALLMDICKDIDDVASVDLEMVMSVLRNSANGY